MNERIPGNDAGRGEQFIPNSALDLLKHINQKVSRLEAQSQNALRVKRDAVGYQQALLLKTKILAELPSEIEKLSERGIDVPSEVIDSSSHWSGQARESIETNNYFGMSVLLIPQGSKTGDPNQLEKLIKKLEDPKSPK